MQITNSSPSPAADRQALLERLLELGWITSTQTVFLHQAIAQTVGLNATDAKCIDLILRAPGATMTPGQLAAASGLSSGAVTHILDRLERRRFVERQRDTNDRRKLFVRVRPDSMDPLAPEHDAIAKATMRLVEGYSDAELRLIGDYLERVALASGQALARLVARRRAGPKRD
jgi:DNA-binding MarR family transcriptional regulator